MICVHSFINTRMLWFEVKKMSWIVKNSIIGIPHFKASDKAGREGNQGGGKMRKQQCRALAKEGEPFINLLIYFSTPFYLF